VVATTPPHDIIGRVVEDHLPRGAGAAPLRGLMARAHDVLVDVASNPTKATDVWLWGQGRAPSLPLFRDRWGLSGAAVAAADLVKGISVSAGLEAPQVPGATAFLDTDYAAKARMALTVLERVDFVYVHVEAPDEAGHMGDIAEKVKAIEAVDREIVGRLVGSRLVDALLVLPDHPTPIRVRTHVAAPVPFVLWRRGREPDVVPGGSSSDRQSRPIPAEDPSAGRADTDGFGEAAAAATGVRLESGSELMAAFLERRPSVG
jgi:2,3-bisphosphoglycerate-independent phosphoglycerate mutase